MDYLLVIIACSSLMLNFLMYKKLAPQQTILVIEAPSKPEAVDSTQFEERQSPDSKISLEPVATTGMTQAWVNRTGIPLSEKVYTPALSGPPPLPGPLERPGGFV